MDKRNKQLITDINTVSYEEYMSPSENYFLTIANMNMKIYNVLNKELKVVKEKYVSQVCITKDDKHLIYSKTNSAMLYIYDIKNNYVKNKKILKRGAEIKFIIQADKYHFLIGLVNYKKSIIYDDLYRFEYSVYLYDLRDNSILEFVLDDNLEFDDFPIIVNNIIYIPCAKLNYERKWMMFSNNELKPLNQSIEILDTCNHIEISKHEKYIACRYDDHIDLYDINEMKIVQVIRKPKIKDDFEDEALRKACRGHFGINRENQEVYYSICENKIDIYNFETNQWSSIIVDCNTYIMDCLISFNNNQIFFRIPDIVHCYCHICDLNNYI
jgi:hypothetical protein